MGKEYRGLRVREYLVIQWILWGWPCWLVLDRIAGGVFKGGWWVGFIISMIVGSIVICIAEDRLEARGRRVASGWDITLSGMWARYLTWASEKGYLINFAAALFVCANVAFLSLTRRLWPPDNPAKYLVKWWCTTPLNMAAIAMNVIVAVVTMPRDRKGS